MATKSMWRLLAVMSATVFALAIAASAFAQAPPSPPHTFYGSGATVDGEAAADGAVVTASNEDGEAVGTATIAGGEWNIDVETTDAASVVFSIDGSEASMGYEVESSGLTNVSLALSSPAWATVTATTPTPTTAWTTPTTVWATPMTPTTWATADDADDMDDTDDADDMDDTDDADDMGDTDDADDMGAGDGDAADDMGDDPMALPDTGSGGLAGGSSLPVLPLALAISIVVALGGVMAVRRTRA